MIGALDSIEKHLGFLWEEDEEGKADSALKELYEIVRQEILDITGDFPEIIFLVFTNGLLINEEILAKVKGKRNAGIKLYSTKKCSKMFIKNNRYD